MGEIDQPGDSLLTFYSDEGDLLMKLETGLDDVCALAYSPTGNLYALDFAWGEGESGGLYRLDKSAEAPATSCLAVEQLALDRPTAMAFAPGGELYIVQFGAEESGATGGRLLRVAAGL